MARRWSLVVLVIATSVACGRLHFESDDTSDPDPARIYAAAVLADRPLAYWRFEDVSAGMAIDEVGAATVAIEVSATRGVAGSGALHFDGSSTRIDAGDRFGFGGAPYTIELWIEPERLDDQVRFVISRVSNTDPSDGYAVYYAKTFTISSRTIAAVEQGYASGPGFEPRTHHVVVTYDGDETALYVDAVYQGGMRADPLPVSAGRFVIGDSASPQFFKTLGLLDEIALYDTALPAARIAAHFAAGK